MTLLDYLQEILRQFAQAIMWPVLIILVALIILALWAIGAVIVEFVTERRHFKAYVPDIINRIEASDFECLPDIVCESKLLWAQKSALLMVANNAGVPEDALFAMAKSEIARVNARYRRKVAFSDLLTKIAPMMGLMATLIPLGPGIVAMGKGDVTTLSASLGVAFDGTVAGLVAAVVSLSVSHMRRRWYADYACALESLMTTILEKAQMEREAGAKLPSGFGRDGLSAYQEKAKQAASDACAHHRTRAARDDADARKAAAFAGGAGASCADEGGAR